MKYGIFIAFLIVACILGAYINISLPLEYEYMLRDLGIYKLTYGDIEQQKFVMLKFALMWIIGMVLLTNNWAKAWFSWVIICLFCHYNAYALERTHYILFFLVLFHVLKDRLNPKGITIIYNTIAVVVLLNVAWMIYQANGGEFLYFPKAGYEGTPIGVYGNTNNSGALIALGLPVFFRKKWWIALAPCLYGLYLSNAFVSIFASLAGICIYIALTSSWKAQTAIILVSAIVIIGYGYFVENRSHFKDGNLRIPYWTKIYNEVSKKPVKGHGVAMFRHIFSQIDMITYGTGSPPNKCDKPVTFHKAHNDYLEMVFNQGYIGLLLFIGFVFSNIIPFAKGIKTHHAIVAFTAVVIAMVVSFGHYTTHSTLIVLPLIYLSILTNQTKERIKL